LFAACGSRTMRGMERRDFLLAGAGVGALIVAHEHEAVAQPKKPDDKAGAARTALATALQSCLAKAQLCAAHCEAQLATGNKEFARCAGAVADTLATGWATLALVQRKSVSSKKVVEACAAVCKECSAACLEHKAHWSHGMHAECKECMESCDACIKACAAFLAA
jgi:Cys-rich four helix bundle protein (predicted Tat secretion target)